MWVFLYLLLYVLDNESIYQDFFYIIFIIDVFGFVSLGLKQHLHLQTCVSVSKYKHERTEDAMSVRNMLSFGPPSYITHKEWPHMCSICLVRVSFQTTKKEACLVSPSLCRSDFLQLTRFFKCSLVYKLSFPESDPKCSTKIYLRCTLIRGVICCLSQPDIITSRIYLMLWYRVWTGPHWQYLCSCASTFVSVYYPIKKRHNYSTFFSKDVFPGNSPFTQTTMGSEGRGGGSDLREKWLFSLERMQSMIQAGYVVYGIRSNINMRPHPMCNSSYLVIPLQVNITRERNGVKWAETKAFFILLFPLKLAQQAWWDYLLNLASIKYFQEQDLYICWELSSLHIKLQTWDALKWTILIQSPEVL